jgi:hypothetical protein
VPAIEAFHYIEAQTWRLFARAEFYGSGDRFFHDPD